MSVRFLEDLSVDGNVGIGTTSPSSTLTINQTDDNGIKLIGYDDRDDASANIYIDSGGNLKINNTNGSGSGYILVEAENYLNLRANSFVYFTSNVRVYDSNQFGFGSGNDLVIQHDGSHSYISQSGTGNLYIQQNTDDADMIFQCDNGSGGTSIYMMLDGSESRISTKVNNRFDDNVKLELGTSGDLDLLHDGSNSYIHHNGTGSLFMKADTGDINIINYTNDRDITLQSDDGSGGVTPYLTLDGSDSKVKSLKQLQVTGGIELTNGNLNMPDNSIIRLGSSTDLQIYHNGTNSNIINYAGDLVIRNGATDKDIILQSDDGSGGETAYLTLDGSTTHSYFSAGNVGIGTTSPSVKLDISGSAKASGTVAAFGNSTAGFSGHGMELRVINGVGSLLSLDRTTVSYKPAEIGGSYIMFDVYGGEKMRVASDGNVGIGTTSPTQKLHVAGNARVTGAYYDSANSPGTGGQVLTSTATGTDWIDPTLLPAESAEKVVQSVRMDEAVSKGDPLVITGYHGSNGPAIVERADATNATKMPAYGVALEDYARNATGLMIAVGDFDHFDTSSYNVGDTLYVAVGGGMTNVKPTGTALIQNMGIVSRKNANNGDVEIVAIGRTNDVPNLPEGRLFVGTSDNTSLTSDVVYIDDTNDRVGIGTTSPTEKLHVEGRIRLGSTPVICSHDNVGIDIDQNNNSGSNYFRVTRDGETTELFRVQENGNVGIGTSSPSSTLSVKGELSISDSTDTHIAIAGRVNSYPSPSANSSSIVTTRDGGSYPFNSYGHLVISSRQNDERDILLRTNDTDRVVVKGSGNVGIGTTSPGSKLHVSESASAATADLLYLENTGSGGNEGVSIVFNPMFDATSMIASNREGFGSDATNLSFHTSVVNGDPPIERMRIASGGNVGIGTSNPAVKLDVAGDAQLQGTSPRLVMKETGTSKDFSLKVQTDGRFSVLNDNLASEVLTIEQGGNVGIGTTGPVGKLTIIDASASSTNQKFHVGRGTNAGLYITDDDATAYIKSIQDENAAGYGNLTLMADDAGSKDGYISFNHSDTGEKMRITNGGNVGIGTTSPDTLLEVSKSTGAAVRITSTATGNGANVTLGSLEYYGNDASVPGAGIKSSIVAKTEASLGDDSNLIFSTSDGTTNNIERLRINSSGNVGIGTTSPDSTLDVNGAITLSDASNEIIKSYGSIRLNIDSDNNQTDRIFIVSTGSNSELFRVDESGNGTFQGDIELGHASDTTIARASAGKVTIEGAPIQTTQMSMSHHNFYFNTSSTTIDYFVPFNSITESSNPTITNYYGRMVAPYDGRIVKAVINTTAAIGTACSAQFWVATSAGVFAPSPAETVSSINLNTANTAATATFSGTSTAEFSEGDVVGLSIQKSGTTSTAYIQVTIVWEYTV